MTAGHADALAQALDITEQMLVAASQTNWVAVVELDALRQGILRDDASLRSGDEARLGLLLERNSLLTQAATTAREAIKQELGQHNYNHKALHVYMSSSD